MRKSEDFIPSLEEGITERVDLPVCAIEHGENTSNGNKERTNVEENVDKTATELQIRNKEEGITERVDLPVCAVEPGENTLNKGEKERANVEENVDKTATELQIRNKESLKHENAFAEKDKTGHVVQHSQDFPLCAEGAWNNTSNKAETNIPISGPGFIYRPLDYDEDALYASVNGKTIDGLYLH